MLADLLDLILPPRCGGCGAPDIGICAGCAAALTRRPAPQWPDPPPPGLPDCWSATGYDGAARRLLLAYKERGRTALAPGLAGCLATVAEAALQGSGVSRGAPVALVPVPSARSAIRKRGHDPLRALASGAVGELRCRGRNVTLFAALRHRRRVADQSGLGSAERAANLDRAFEVPPDQAVHLRRAIGRAPVIVLVDDIMTTGATLAEAARALREAGAPVRVAATLAATRRRRAAVATRPGGSPFFFGQQL